MGFPLTIWLIDTWRVRLLQEIYLPSRPGYTDPHVIRRVLDYLLFMNSKVRGLPPARKIALYE